MNKGLLFFKRGLCILLISGVIISNSESVFAAYRKNIKYDYSKLKSVNVDINTVKNDHNGISIKWNKVKKADGYIIYRREKNDEEWVELDRTSQKKYLDENVDSGVTYEYGVQAYQYTNYGISFTKISDSLKNNMNTVICASPKSADKVFAKYLSDNKVKLKWKGTGEESGFQIFRSVNGGNWNLIKDITDSNTNKYSDNVQDCSGTINYKVIPYEIINGVTYMGNEKTQDAYASSDTGIDVSYHNGIIDWKKVKKSGVKVAFIRIGYGDFKKKKGAVLDNKFRRNVKLARENGIKVGIYFYGNATKVSHARKEAKFVVDNLKKVGEIDLPVAYDYENSYRKHFRYRKENTKIVDEFCSIIKKSGYDTLIYSDNNMLTKYVKTDKLSKYGYWVAYWTYDSDDYPVELENVKVWQYCDNGRIKGINTYTDRNVIFIN